MKVIIAGSRTVTNYECVKQAVKDSKFKITEIVSGHAEGVDKLGEKYAKENNIKLKLFEADWKNVDKPGAIVKENGYGKYNAKAGIERNEDMGKYADALIAIVHNESKGTEHMINFMERLGKKTYVKVV